MATLTNICLWPFAVLFRTAYAHPWLTIIVSAGLALAAEVLHELVWMSIFLCFGAYILMWLDETQHPEPVEMGVADNIE